jgi:hypothetical protein
MPHGHERTIGMPGPRTYTIRWEELVLDGEDNPESVNVGEDIVVTAASLKEARRVALGLANRAVNRQRGGQISSGSFFAHVFAIVDPRGNTHKVSDSYMIVDGQFNAQA